MKNIEKRYQAKLVQNRARISSFNFKQDEVAQTEARLEIFKELEDELEAERAKTWIIKLKESWQKNKFGLPQIFT